MKVTVRGLYYYLGRFGLRKGMQVRLRPEPTSRYDSNAVAVDRLDGTLIGYVNRIDAARLSPCLLRGMKVDATVYTIHQGKRNSVSCVVNLDISEESLQLLEEQQTVHASPPTQTSNQKSSCFVATVVFESPDHPTVEWLRWWRDTHLVRHVPGRLFVGFYRHTGPLLARLVAQTPSIRGHLKIWIERFVVWKR
jgi:hypothetical protein